MAPSEQSWLFRQGELILGPVPVQQIIDRLYSGELTATSEAKEMSANLFRPLSEYPEFSVHIAKANAKRRVEAQEASIQKKQKRKTTTIVSAVAAVATVLLLVVAGIGSYLAIHAPSLSSEDEQITMDPPSIGRAKQRSDDELVDYRGGGTRKGSSAGAVARGGGGESSPAKAKMGTADSEGLQMGEVDESGINAVVAKHKPSLIPCIRGVATPGLVAKIPIEFSISEAGKVTRVWVDNPDFKNTPLQDCLMKELQKWPFKAGQSGAAVNLSFNIGKR